MPNLKSAKSNNYSRTLVFISLSASLIAVNPAFSADVAWDSTINDWFVNTNWDPTTIPIATDDVYIDNGGTAQVGAGIGQFLFLYVGYSDTGSLEISNGGEISGTFGAIGSQSNSTGSVTVNGAGSSWVNSDLLAIGVSGVGSLSISNAGVVSNTIGDIGYNVDGIGSVTVDGTDSTWNNSNRLYIGDFGTASLAISNGGVVSNTAGHIGYNSVAAGSVTVDGVGSTWTNSSSLFIGHAGDGSLAISNGGAVSNTDSYIGTISGSSGSVTVDGVGSSWTNSDSLEIGAAGTGSLAISNGGVVSNTLGVIGSFSSGIGSVTVDGVGSTWTNSSWLFIGNVGDGSLAISNGGAVTNTVSHIGSDTGSTGVVSVDGTGSLWNSTSNLYIGNWGTASLDISNGGKVTSGDGSFGDETHVGEELGSDGSVTVSGNGSFWDVQSFLRIGYHGTGRLDIRNGGVVDTEYFVAVGTLGTGNGSLTVDGIGSTLNSVGNELHIGYEGTGDLTISNGGVINNRDAYIGNKIGSTGSVTVDGTGSAWNNSRNFFIGDSGTGSVSVSNGGTVNVSGDTNIGSNIGSTGTLNIGTGSAAGVFNTASINGGLGTATINFNHTDTDYYFTNDGSSSGASVLVTGSTIVNQIGSGKTVLTGTNTYTGDTTIDAGTLWVNGSNSHSTTRVNTGGILGGTGTVGDVILSGGTFAPGNSIGTINVSGNVDFSGGGLYQVEVDAAGNSDLINATGTATLTGGSVEVLAENTTYQASTDYTILNAMGGLDGTFNSVTSNLAFLEPTLNYDANNVFLNLARNTTSFSDVAFTPNQLAVANTLSNSNEPSLEDLIDDIEGLTEDDARQAFDSLGGVQYANIQSILPKLSQTFQNLLGDRLKGDTLAFNDSSMQGLNSGDTLSAEEEVWLTVYGSSGDIDNTSKASGSDYDTQGIIIGTERDIHSNLRLGVAAGYADSDIDAKDFDGDVDSYQLAVYGGWKHQDYFINGQFDIGQHQFDSTRKIIVGATNSTASADYDSEQYSMIVEGGKNIKLSPVTTLTPFAGLSYFLIHRDSFTETGAGAENLKVSSEKDELFRSQLGLQVSHVFKTDNDKALTGDLSMAWVHDYGSTEDSITAGFSTASNTKFNITGPKLDRDRLALSAGFTGALSDDIDLNIHYNAEISSSDDHQYLSATLRYMW